MPNYVVTPVGYVKNQNEENILKYSNNDIELSKKIARKQREHDASSHIFVRDEFIDCLDGIEDFSHLIILFWTHKTPEKARQIKKVHPAGMKNMPIKGIFATRSPVRPNPICNTTVKLVERKGNVLVVEGLDAIDGSPIIDIKPHLPSYDSPLNVKLADWMYVLMEEFKKMAEKDSEIKSHRNMRSHPYINPKQK
jgi:tRNA-Thr(GGU) m(6)t(6)A37 methyltransferase TsaA